jgi:hypothetical protein
MDWRLAIGDWQFGPEALSKQASRSLNTQTSKQAKKPKKPKKRDLLKE